MTASRSYGLKPVIGSPIAIVSVALRRNSNVTPCVKTRESGVPCGPLVPRDG